MTRHSDDILSDEKLGEGSGTFMYWRKPDGWIVIGPAWPVEYRRQAKKGMTALEEYGEFDDNPKEWNIHLDPYKQILERGGAKEFCMDQILEAGWHRKAPYRVVFPQLEDNEKHEDFICSYCRKPFVKEVHLYNHQSITHKEVSAQQNLASALGKVLSQNQGGGANSELIALLTKMVADMQETQKEQEKRMAMLMEKLGETEELIDLEELVDNPDREGPDRPTRGRPRKNF